MRVLTGNSGEQPSPDDLLDGETYYKKYAPRWTGTLCGRVTKADGTPFGEAWLDMMQLRDEPFAVNTDADSDQSRKRMAASASGTSVLKNICSLPNGWTLRGLRTTRKLRRSKSMAATTQLTCNSAPAKCVSTRCCSALLVPMEACSL